MNVAEYLLHDKDCDDVALVDLHQARTYRELLSTSGYIAAYFACKGVKGDRVLLIGENSFFWISAYLGALRAGMVCVPVPPRTSVADLSHVIRTAEPRFAFVDATLFPIITDELRGLAVVTDRRISTESRGCFVEDLEQIRTEFEGTTPEFVSMATCDLAALMFTSGSTGKPRGVMVSHGNIIANTDSIVEYLELTKADRIMTVLPFHYCFGTSLLHTHLRVGGSMMINSRFIFVQEMLRHMQETDCTGFAGVPSHFQILLRQSALTRMTFPRLRYVQQAGGHLAPALVRELRNALPGTKIFVMYGQTEATARLSYLPPELLDQKLGSIGRGIPGVTLRVLDPSGAPIKPGQVGEVVAKGENVALGYWCDPDESALYFRDGWLRTGDLATVDEDDFIYIVDRAKDVLKCGGKRLSCREVEDVLLECKDVIEAAVVGVPDEVLGEAAKAFVVPRDCKCEPLSDLLRNFCKARLAPQFVPKQIVIVQCLPKNSSGKVVKTSLRMT